MSKFLSVAASACCVLILFGSASTSWAVGPEILEGCQGEGCGCTRETTANKDFTVFSEMDLKSKKLGKFKSGAEAKALKSFTKVIKPGKASVIQVGDPSLGLKAGDEVSHIFYLGEGFTKVMKAGKWIEFDDSKAKLKILEKPSFETWLEIKVGKIHGYTTSFPFLGCLE
jgi:hypothetical protein